MMKYRPPHLFNRLKLSITGLAVILFTGCGVIPKDYPKNKAFVYKTNITVEGDISKEEKNKLTSQLHDQLADSMQARSVAKFNFKNFFHSSLKNPPAYDSAAASQSVRFMGLLMKAHGYYYSNISHDSSLKIRGDQYRTTVNFNVKTGKLLTLDTVTYKFANSEVQSITNRHQQDAIVKKGDAFAKAPMAAERDRLVNLYRNNGYLRLTGSEIIGLWDTLDLALLQPTFDPFEQLNLMEMLKARQEKPTAKLEYRFRPGFDSSRLIKYYIGNITMYPDLNLDSSGVARRSVSLDSGKFVINYSRNIFKPNFLRRNVYMKFGELYQQDVLLRTINRFNSLGAWRLVSFEPLPRHNTDTVDFVARLSPANKYAYNITLEGNRNQSQVTGDLWGVGLNFSLQNRNFARSSNQSVTNFRYGVEFGGSRGIQTQQTLLNQNIYFPRIIAPAFIPINQKYRDRARTVFSFGGSITDRIDYFNQKNLSLSWGYEYEWENKAISLRFPNFEYSFLQRRDSLNNLIANNPVIRNLFTDGLILSAIFRYDVSWGKPSRLNFFRLNLEESGILFGTIRTKFFDTNLYRYAKVEAEISRKVVLKKWIDGTDKTVLAMRLLGGVGYELGSTVHPDKQNNLPFFKAFFAGGPNSMRAWQLRRLGPGSLVKNFSGTGGQPERFGDFQLEGNIEYRFHLFRAAGFKFNGALFVDAGNIWYIKKAASPDPEAVFNPKRLWKDLAIGTGAGLRMDFGFVLIRLDYSYKAKDPSPSIDNISSQNKWFHNLNWNSGVLQLGINYPFVL